MRKNIVILISVLLAAVILYFLFRERGEVKITEEATIQEAQPAVPAEQAEEELSEEVSPETSEEEGVTDQDLVVRKKEYLKTLDKIDKYFSERVDVLRKEIANLSSADPQREKMEHELEKIEKEYETLKQEISKMKSEVGAKDQ